MKTATILILTLLLSPWTVHANGEAEKTPVIESLKTVHPKTIDRQAFEQTAVQPDTTNKQKLLERFRERDYLSVIITYKMDGFTNERELNENQSRAQRSQIAQMHNDFVRELENVDFTYQIGRKLNLRPRISITVDKNGLKYLYDLQSIDSIIENKSVPRHLSESTSIITSDDVNDFLNVYGEERKIFIIDDGVDYGHSAFSGRVAGGACYSTTDTLRNISSLCHNGADFDIGFEAGKPCDDSNVDCEHGTHVAGIAAGNDGVAPEANIIPLLALSKHENAADCSPESAPCGAYQTIDLEASLEYVYLNYWNNGLSVINMSLGGGEFNSTCDTEPLKDIIEDLLFEDIITVASSGNRNYDNAMSWPACISDVISVGATDKQDVHWTESDSSGSNAASFLDLVAPGVDINSAVPGGSTASFTGTSQAAPHVAGTIALMAQAAPAPFLSPTTVRSTLHSTADEVPGMNPFSFTNEYGHGRLNTFDAVIEALKINPSATVYDQDRTISSQETLDFYDETIYVLDPYTLTVNGNLWLENTNLYLAGTLEGTGKIDLVGTSQILVVGDGNNNFEGDYGNGTTPPLPTYTDTTFTVSTILMEPGVYTGTTTIEPGVEVTVWEDVEVTLDDEIVMEESGSEYGKLIVRGTLQIENNAIITGGMIRAAQEGVAEIGNSVLTTATRKNGTNGGIFNVQDNSSFHYSNNTMLEIEENSFFIQEQIQISF